MAAASARVFMLSRATDLSRKKSVGPILFPPRTPSLQRLTWLLNRAVSSGAGFSVISCLSGGGVSDDYFVSTRQSKLDRGFAVIANMVNRIEPLDTSVISKGVSDSAKDSMKQTISSMLGLLPSDHFSVSVNISEQPMHRLLISSIITGYTLWNAEYRVSLRRNFNISGKVQGRKEEVSREKQGFELEKKDNAKGWRDLEEFERISPQVSSDLSPEALGCIQQMQFELSSAKEELDAQKKETLRIECDRANRNDLLDYLRSLDPEMVTELSQPSSVEVDEIIHQLVQNALQRLFKDETSGDFVRESMEGSDRNKLDTRDNTRWRVGASRDYLAKLLFWCMLLGHHLRGLENRLHLSCAVGLL